MNERQVREARESSVRKSQPAQISPLKGSFSMTRRMSLSQTWTQIHTQNPNPNSMKESKTLKLYCQPQIKVEKIKKQSLRQAAKGKENIWRKENLKSKSFRRV